MFVDDFFVKSLNANGDRVEEGEETAAEGGGVAGMGVTGSWADYNAISAFSRSKQTKDFINWKLWVLFSFRTVIISSQ